MKKQYKPNTPWQLYGSYGYDDGAVDSEGEIIFTDAITEDDAKFIIKVVNYHDRLVFFLKMYYEDIKSQIPKSGARDCRLNQIKELLNEIEES